MTVDQVRELAFAVWTRAQLHAYLDRCPVGERDQLLNERIRSTGRSLLSTAVLKGDVDMVALLTRYGADARRLVDRDGITAAHRAAAMGRVDVLEALGFDALVEASLPTGERVLHYAASKGMVDVVNYLLDIGIDVDQLSFREGLTPLGTAVMSKQAAVARLLIDRGADVNFDVATVVGGSAAKSAFALHRLIPFGDHPDLAGERVIIDVIFNSKK